VGYEATLAAFRRGDNAEAQRLARLDLDQASENGDTGARLDALCMLARVALREGNLDEVEARALQAHSAASTAEDRRLLRMPLHLLAVAARMGGRHDEARDLYTRSIALNDELGEARFAAVEHRNLAYVEIRAGQLDRARELFAESRRRLAGLDYPALAPI
jgi:tetratricopeptide (TPR) repeat protein